jgi:multimeric flavodoxin WrbA
VSLCAEENNEEKPMNVLGISGSPNRNGNTAYALKHGLGILQNEGVQTRYITLAGKKIHPCRGCWQCAKTKRCVDPDDMDEIIEAMRWCHGLILASPVYFGLVSGQMKVMMDRCVVLRPSYEMPLEMFGKTGCGIACAGFRNGGQELALQNIQTFLLQQGMRVINDGPAYSHSGGTIAGTAKEDALGLETVEHMMHALMAALNHKKII